MTKKPPSAPPNTAAAQPTIRQAIHRLASTEAAIAQALAEIAECLHQIIDYFQEEVPE